MFRTRTISRALWHQQAQIRTHYARPCASILCVNKPNTRNLNTVTVEDSYVKKFMNAVGWMDQSRTRLKLTGYFLYECIPENVSYAEWFERYFLYECIPENVSYAEWFESLELPDTFASWFIITELHVWMLMVRYMAEDILLPGANPAIARKQVSELSEQFQASLIAELDKIPSEDLRSKPKITWLSISDH
ncbi:hypothetical protein HF086_003400 [Spodoptera exigua]|uniref:Ubiquinol-cytochrome c chaperone domain-containing protein n=1 Tax=Spodoptera exigua TaxID=7107 RepID=A0A922MFQ7_SPOEX|nr:hypothetical protein HF086_003400 [Spodoptera exigua]